ncbi:hypothetical protein ACWDGI_20915 [Streptomyces sp. NPDC001220]
MIDLLAGRAPRLLRALQLIASFSAIASAVSGRREFTVVCFFISHADNRHL